MGTRGIFGVRFNDVDKLTYNHFDSYPGGLGQATVDNIKRFESIDEMKQLAKKLRMVSEDQKPTPLQIRALQKFADLNVSGKSLNNWYCLLRQTQGDLHTMLKCGYAINNKEFIKDSLFCEWGYIVNLDTEMLEVYRGFQEKDHDKGRYADHKTRDGYYPCALVAEFPLNDLPVDLALTIDNLLEEEK
jgi:hypothetical protein